MKKSLANQIAKLWNEQNSDGYELTRTKAVVEEDRKGEYSVEIAPEGNNIGNSFHCVEDMADFMRAFRVHGYVGQKVKDGMYILVGRMF